VLLNPLQPQVGYKKISIYFHTVEDSISFRLRVYRLRNIHAFGVDVGNATRISLCQIESSCSINSGALIVRSYLPVYGDSY
jgi:hypothetical protein